MKRFLMTTALVAAAGTAQADGHAMSPFVDMTTQAWTVLYASDLIGARIYAVENGIADGYAYAAGDETNWDDLGEVNDIILSQGGGVDAIILGIGGFLGIGERDVAVDMDALKVVRDGPDATDYFLVVAANRARIEDAPAYDLSMTVPGAETETAAGDKAFGAMVPVVSQAQGEGPVMRPAVERDGYATMAPADLTTEMLTGARVYDVNDEDIGEVSELILSTDGSAIDHAVIDVGGFLGIGEKAVALPMDALQILRADNGGDLRVYVDMTRETLEAEPTYEG